MEVKDVPAVRRIASKERSEGSWTTSFQKEDEKNILPPISQLNIPLVFLIFSLFLAFYFVF
jgi:hypothetical protein